MLFIVVVGLFLYTIILGYDNWLSKSGNDSVCLNKVFGFIIGL